jgi:hypothetical protein
MLTFSLLGLTAKLPASTSTGVIKEHDQHAPSPTIKHEGSFCNNDTFYLPILCESNLY